MADTDPDDAHDADPLGQVQAWLDEARRAGVGGWDTAVVATSTLDGRPSARAVLLRGLDARGFVFYTDTRSRKGRELAANPRAALVLVWAAQERQVRVEGEVMPVSDGEADAYFAGRPRGHQIASWASQQSDALASRAELERRFADFERRFAGRDVPRPPYWSGYRIVPDGIELWQGRPDRLHHRVVHRRSLDRWETEILWP